MKAVGYQNRDVKGIFIYEAIWIVGTALLAGITLPIRWKLLMRL